MIKKIENLIKEFEGAGDKLQHIETEAVIRMLYKLKEAYHEDNKIYKEYNDHENKRKELWVSAWVALGNSINCITPDSATRWADSALKDFDTRFPAVTKRTD